jgi:two-component system phosphate regulon sensor histidine kinase PhoR
MCILISITLGLALVLALVALWRRQQIIHQLHNALLKKQPILHEFKPIVGGLEDVCHAANDLIAEVGRLQQLRSGQLTQLEATLGSLQEAVLIVDSANHIILANNALQGIFPRAANILGQRLERILHSAAFLQYVESVRKNEAQPQFEIEFDEGNRSIWVEVTGSNIPSLSSDKAPWALFVLHDITKQKKLEAVRKDFVANVSHELRTPLSIIKGYVETLVDEHETIPTEDRDKFLRTIQRHTERLNSLLEDLLTLSRLESINPGLRRETIDFAQLLNNVLDDFRARPTAAEHKISSNFAPVLGPVLVDPLKITQVLENLLDNALKYTPKGSAIDVSATMREGKVEVCVKDTGPGIPEADLPHIFERFYRVDKGRSREKGGTGLGLSIVKHIVQLHGGQVRVESKLGQGTAFYFTVPQRLNAPVEAGVR